MRSHVAPIGESPGVPISLDRPTSARAYGYMLGGKDHYPVDREFIAGTVQNFPECVDIARQNRLFLHRVVRFLVEEAGITQFLDLGCGLPTDQNVHQVAHRYNPEARVVYVDADPVVLTHGRALLSSTPGTTVLQGDLRDPGRVLGEPEAMSLLNLREPMAVLFFSVGHHLKDSEGQGARHAVRTVMDHVAVSGSYIAFSQVVIDDPAKAARMSADIDGAGIPWQTRTPAHVEALFEGLTPVEPGLVNVRHWRPDPGQPALDPVPRELERYVGATDSGSDVMEYGGVFRKP